MSSVLEQLRQRCLLVSDGAMGTPLQEAGLAPGECPELWNVTRPEVVGAVTRAYLAAGAQIVSTNSFGGSRLKLDRVRLAGRAFELNRAAAAVARAAVAGAAAPAIVAASLGPTGRILEAEGGDARDDDVYRAFAEQAEALAAGGADAITVETMSSARETLLAVRAASAAGLPVLCTFTFSRGPKGFRTFMGLTPERAACESAAAGVAAIGTNCGNGIDPMVEIVAAMHAAVPELPLLVQANAGAPLLRDGRTVYFETPEHWATVVRPLVEAGATIVGGCDGTTPAHISAIAAAVKALSLRPASPAS